VGTGTVQDKNLGLAAVKDSGRGWPPYLSPRMLHVSRCSATPGRVLSVRRNGADGMVVRPQEKIRTSTS